MRRSTPRGTLVLGLALAIGVGSIGVMRSSRPALSSEAPGPIEQAGQLLLRGRPYSGLVIERDASQSIVRLSSYRDGRRDGWQRTRWSNGRLAEESYVARGVFEGARRTWYPSGAPAQESHFRHGREAGRQQRWSESGTLLANYFVRDGRRYGVPGQRHCYTPEGGLP